MAEDSDVWSDIGAFYFITDTNHGEGVNTNQGMLLLYFRTAAKADIPQNENISGNLKMILQFVIRFV